MFAALFRIVFGLIVASLVAGAVQVLFALTPSELAVAGPDRWQIAGFFALQSSIFSAVFAAPLVLLIGVFSEIMRVRSFAFFVLAGVFVALAGFATLYSGEGPNDPTLANSYAIAAYLTTGFMSGLAYWLVAGRFAGGRHKVHESDLRSVAGDVAVEDGATKSLLVDRARSLRRGAVETTTRQETATVSVGEVRREQSSAS